MKSKANLTSQKKRSKKSKSKKTFLNSSSVSLGSFGMDTRVNSYVLKPDLYKEPTARRVKYSSEKYIPFLTDNNNLLDELYSILNTSSTNNAIVQQKNTLLRGDGFLIVEGRQSILTRLKGFFENAFNVKDEKKESLSSYLHEVNPENETMQDILDKAGFEFWGYGNAFIELIRVQEGGQKQFYVRHMPIHMCRPVKTLKGSRVVKYIGVSDGWQVGENCPSDVVDYPLYPNFEKIGDEDNSSERCLIHLKNYRSQFFYWGVPDYVAATLWGEMEYRIAKFNQAKFDNGFTPSAIIKFNGRDYTSEEGRSLIEKVTESFTQTGNNSKLFTYVTNSTEETLDVKLLEQNIEGQFLELSNISRQQIVTAHRWTMSLAGMGIAGQLGSNQQIAAEFAILNQTVISPVQRMFEAKMINVAIQEAGQWIGEDWKNLSVLIKSKTPVSFLGDIAVGNVLTINEQREILGYEPLKQNKDGTE